VLDQAHVGRVVLDIEHARTAWPRRGRGRAILRSWIAHYVLAGDRGRCREPRSNGAGSLARPAAFTRALGAADRAAQRKREELERRGRRDTQATVRRFIDLCGVVLGSKRSPANKASSW
jgi:hypothetical protein